MLAVDVPADVDDELLALGDERARVEISSSRSSEAVDADLVAVDDEPVVAADVVVLGACAANHAPSPTNDAALTTPAMRRARRAGCGFFMRRACAGPDNAI